MAVCGTRLRPGARDGILRQARYRLSCDRDRTLRGRSEPLTLGEARDIPRDLPINLAAERHDKVGDAVEALPSPGIELSGLVVARRQRIDLRLVAGKAQRKPFLPLPTELCEPMRRTIIGREFVNEPIGLAEIFGAPDARLLPQLAQRRGAQILARIDAALRHLPFETRQDDLRSVVAKASADQDQAAGVEQGDPDIEAIGLLLRHSKLSRVGESISDAQRYSVTRSLMRVSRSSIRAL